jgi:hypothetical protein
MIETPEEFAKRYWNSLAPHYSEHRKTLAYFIAEHDAAIRQECEDRAVEYFLSKTRGWMESELRAACRQGR